jgi:hypothetical protein
MPQMKKKLRGEWMAIVNDLLEGDERARKLARNELWAQVIALVTTVMRLPVGPLNDDPDAKRDIAIRTIEKLEANDFAHLKEWRARQLRGRSCAQLLGFVKLVARGCAINFARCHRKQIAPRGQPFRWAQEELRADP